MSTATQSQRHVPEHFPLVYADILSQAVTGELIGMQNYASLVEICESVEDMKDAVEHSASEMGHAVAFQSAAQDIGVPVIVNPSANYWGRIRAAFLEHVRAGDYSACLIIQEVMLESFAVSMYKAIAEVTEGEVGRIFGEIGTEEESHLEHAIEELQEELEVDRDAFEDKVHALHRQVMTILAEMVSAKDPAGHCELCAGDCVKDSLDQIGLSSAILRGKALNFYLSTLDRIGVRGEKSLEWVANLPA
ncbi:MAG: long-chain fatty aldehyde decarbonylase [Gemmatimonadota bacterium]